MSPHPILRFARPAILIGGVFAIIGALLMTGRIEMANGMVFGIVALCLGIAGVFFGAFTTAAWRIVVAANQQNETAQPGDQE
ncbi:hypothetical protein V0U79_01965 [Hyphobacterium sp. HN65]|uniref:CTP synthetase n=1 Tax=Hyphobacterium lacteum TaxID=3116575 RepID=A0ABU7LNF2_9PROT|nr:hypothetical protein [Hyphobacterium sp. HN65]MEE2525114.1 hypothetical protein [Hyphobacterium sp. HN65]